MFMFESSKEEGSQVKLMFSVQIRNVLAIFLLNILHIYESMPVKVRIPNKYRPPIINWEDWSIIHYNNAMLYIHSDVLLSQ